MLVIQDPQNPSKMSPGFLSFVADHGIDVTGRVQSLVAQGLIKLVSFDDASGVMVQAQNGPCLYLTNNDPLDVLQFNRTGWQLKAFLDAVEASEDRAFNG